MYFVSMVNGNVSGSYELNLNISAEKVTLRLYAIVREGQIYFYDLNCFGIYAGEDKQKLPKDCMTLKEYQELWKERQRQLIKEYQEEFLEGKLLREKIQDMLREHIKQFTDEYMDFLRLSNLYNEIYKEIRTGVVTKKEDIFFINGKTITEYMDRISDYAADKSWFLQGKDFSLSAIKENLYHSWNRIVQKN